MQNSHQAITWANADLGFIGDTPDLTQHVSCWVSVVSVLKNHNEILVIMGTYGIY